MKKQFLMLCFFAALALPVSVFSQTFNLGWAGSEVIPKSQFINPAKWIVAHTPGDTCFVTTDTANLYLHWKFAAGNRSKWTICFMPLNPSIPLTDVNLVGMDIKGSDCNINRNVRIKFEDGTSQSTYIWHGLASFTRWCERLSVLKTQFNGTIDWNNIKVVTLEVSSESSPNDTQQDSGTVAFRKLQVADASAWQKTNSFEILKDSSRLDTIKYQALRGILARQASNGLFYTWQEDKSSWLYGHGMLLKILSMEGIWDNGIPVNASAKAAEKLALFLASHQDSKGFWPRAWNTDSGTIKAYVESDGTIWMGDFPWIITGLVNYYAKTGDSRVLEAIQNARSFLYNLIDPSGKFYTLNINTNSKVDVTSVEAYTAAILSVAELGDSIKAVTMLNYITSITWNEALQYWREGTYSSRVVMLGNTWMSQLMHFNNDLQKAYRALSFVGKVLDTKGPGQPEGFDGIGPVATWYEGTLTYICAGGPNSQTVFDSIVKYRYADGTIPAYNDNFGSKVDVWAVNWSSLDATSWLYFAASKKSPFNIYNKADIPLIEKKIFDDRQIKLFPNPTSDKIIVSFGNKLEEVNELSLYTLTGTCIKTFTKTEITDPMVINTLNYSQGVYLLIVKLKNNQVIRKVDIVK